MMRTRARCAVRYRGSWPQPQLTEHFAAVKKLMCLYDFPQRQPLADSGSNSLVRKQLDHLIGYSQSLLRVPVVNVHTERTHRYALAQVCAKIVEEVRGW